MGAAVVKGMVAFKRLVILFLVLASLVQFTAAYVQPFYGMNISSCGFQATDLTCGSSIDWSCRIKDQASGSQGVQYVAVTFGGTTYDATLSSGTKLDGIWTASVTVDDTFGTQSAMSFSMVAMNYDRATCSRASTDIPLSTSDTSCAWDLEALPKISVSCTCGFTEIRESSQYPETRCQKTNTRTVRITPNVGCTDQTVTTRTEICDYCDPQWTAQYGACVHTSEEDPLEGKQTLTYTSANPGCGQATGLLSDTNPPSPNQLGLTCRMDFSATYGKTEDQAAHNRETSTAGDSYTETDIALNIQSDIYDPSGKLLQPVVADFDKDGVAEVVTPVTGGDLNVDGTTTVDTSSWGGTIWSADVAMYGIATYDGHYASVSTLANNDPSVVYDDAYNTGGKGFGVAGVLSDDTYTTYKFVATRYVGGVWAVEFADTLPNTATSKGVVCTVEHTGGENISMCFVMDDSGTLYKYNMKTHVRTAAPVPGANAYGGRVIPLILHGPYYPLDGYVVYVPRYAGLSGVDISGCVLGTACNVGWAIGGGTFNDQSIMGISSRGRWVKSDTSPDTFEVPIYATLRDDSLTSAYLYATVTTMKWIGNAASWYIAEGSVTQISGAGDIRCLSTPAAGHCGTAEDLVRQNGKYESGQSMVDVTGAADTYSGVGLAAAWRSPTTTQMTAPTTPFHYDQVVDISSPFLTSRLQAGATYAVGSRQSSSGYPYNLGNDFLGPVVCSDGHCFALSANGMIDPPLGTGNFDCTLQGGRYTTIWHQASVGATFSGVAIPTDVLNPANSGRPTENIAPSAAATALNGHCSAEQVGPPAGYDLNTYPNWYINHTDEIIAAGSVGGKLYVAVGKNDPPVTTIALIYPHVDIWEYDPSLDQWTMLRSFSQTELRYSKYKNKDFNYLQNEYPVDTTSAQGGIPVDWTMPGVAERMVCDQYGCKWFLARGVVNGVSSGLVYIPKSGTVRLAAPPGGWLFGSPVDSQATVYGYAKTDAAEYFVVRVSPSMSSTPSSVVGNGVLRYPSGSTLPTPIDQRSGDYTAFVGLFADPDKQDTVYWASVPDMTTTASNTCKANASLPQDATCRYDAPLFESQRVSWEYPDTVTNQCLYQPVNGYRYGTGWWVECTSYLMKSENGVKTEVNANGEMWKAASGVTIYNTLQPQYTYTTPSKTWSMGGLDSDGNPYVMFMMSIRSTSKAASTSSSADVGATFAVMSSTGTYFPYTVLFSNVNATTASNPGAASQSAVGTMTLCTDDPTNAKSGSDCRPGIWYRSYTTNYNTDIGHGLPIVAYPSADRGASSFIPALTSGDIQFHQVYNSQITSSSTSNNYLTYECYDYVPSAGLRRSWTQAGANPFCVPNVFMTDTNNDGVDELLSSAGTFSTTAKQISLGVQSDGAVAIPVDMNFDRVTDFLVVSSSGLKQMFSVRPNVVPGKTLSVVGATCVYQPEALSVKVSVYGVSAANPGSVKFKATQSVGSEYTAAVAYQSSPELTFSQILPKTTYTYAITITDQASGESVEKTCTATTPDDENLYPPTPPPVGCTLGNDGQFNTRLQDTLSTLNWQVATSRGGSAPELTGSSLMYVDADGTSSVSHALACDASQLTVEMNVKIGAGSVSFVNLWSDSGYDMMNNLASIYLEEGASGTGVLTVSSDVWGVSQVFDSTIQMDTFTKIGVSFDRSNNRILVYVDDAYVGLLELCQTDTDSCSKKAQDFLKTIREISINHVFGDIDVDYILVDGKAVCTDCKKEDIVEATLKATYLASCTSPSDRDFSVEPAGAGSSYSNIDSYCTRSEWVNSLGGSSPFQRQYCNFADLKAIVKYNQNCYRQAYAYCIAKTFPIMNGDLSVSGDSSSSSPKIASDITAGSAQCQIALATTVATDKVVMPALGTIWNIVVVGDGTLTHYAIVFFAVLLFVAIVILASRPRR